MSSGTRSPSGGGRPDYAGARLPDVTPAVKDGHQAASKSTTSSMISNSGHRFRCGPQPRSKMNGLAATQVAIRGARQDSEGFCSQAMKPAAASRARSEARRYGETRSDQ